VALNVLSVGDNCIDRYRPPIDTAFIGGQAVNVAVHLAAGGHAVAYAGSVGTDQAGERTLAALARRGIDVRLVRRLPGRTGITTVGIDPNGERVILAEDYGVSAPVGVDEEILAAARSADLVYAAHVVDLNPLVEAIPRGTALGVDISERGSVTTARWLAGTRFLFISRAREAPGAIRAEARRLLEAGVGEVVATCGPAGALVTTPDESLEVGTDARSVVDTLGAGDAFAAGYMAGRLAGDSLRAAMAAGARAAAATCQIHGAWAQEPWRVAGPATADMRSGTA
jgi:fructoselysine 6-kinase